MNIFLIGYRCSGKTSVGQALSKRTGFEFVDADRQLTEKEGKTIAEVVADHGWEYFRAREKEELASVCARLGQVVATGGGVVLDPDNVAAMKSCGTLLWLRAKPATILRRMRRDAKTRHQRPALTNERLSDEIEKTLQERTPLYAAAMDIAIDTDCRTVEEICQLILDRLGQRQKTQV